MLLSLAGAQSPILRDTPVTTFGVTVVDPFGLRGDIYLLKPDTDQLPKFKKLKPVGTIYTSALNIPPRDFLEGFPGVTNRFEWFAIDYSGNFYIANPGVYLFQLTSDDGSRLYIDGKEVIDNDGIHSVQSEICSTDLTGGIHRVRVSYFQGPRTRVALILGVARPGEDFRVFSTSEFRPPRNPVDWKYGDPNNLPADPPTAPEKK
jgi:hypothetical protein